MPRDFFYETAITIEHEDGTCRVDTTVRGIASMLVRARFDEVTKPTSAPYRRFVGKADQVRFRRPKGQRITAKAAASRAEGLRKARQAKLPSAAL